MTAHSEDQSQQGKAQPQCLSVAWKLKQVNTGTDMVNHAYIYCTHYTFFEGLRLNAVEVKFGWILFLEFKNTVSSVFVTEQQQSSEQCNHGLDGSNYNVRRAHFLYCLRINSLRNNLTDT